MTRYIIVVLVGVLFAGVACSDATKARLDVAQKTVLEKLDNMLGKMDVQKAEIDNGIKSAKTAVDGVRQAKIRSQVQLDQLAEKVRPFEDKVQACDAALAKLRDNIAADMPAAFAGKSYSVDELKAMASKVIAERKKADSEVAGFKSARDTMTKQATMLADTQQTIESKITTLQAQVARLDSEISAARSMKQAAASMGDANSTLNDNLNELEKKIAILSGDARAALASETDRWSSSTTEKALSEADAFIRDSQGVPDTVSEIDAILGRK